MKQLIVLLLLSVPFLSQAQPWSIAGHSLPELRQSQNLPPSTPSISPSIKFLQLITNSEPTGLSLQEIMLHTPSQQPRAWSYQDLAFFCKLEVKLEKATKLPIKFRLGEVQYAENREGKYGRLQQQLNN
ncbi:MAG: hypothetical protein KTR30_01225 [Saprospiraceae bacterium]|nr:hypothetical protein [Saprospiraceae bacterium]